MRHQNRVKKIGSNSAYKKAILNNLVKSLIQNGKLITTHRKAKEAQKLIERLITYGKKGDVHNRRLAYRYLQNRELVRVLFEEIAPQFEGRKGGYTRVLHLSRRDNDAAPVSILEFVDYTSGGKKKKKVKKIEKKQPKTEKQTEVSEKINETQEEITTEEADEKLVEEKEEKPEEQNEEKSE